MIKASYTVVALLAIAVLVAIVLPAPRIAGEELPTLTSVSIDSDSAASSGADEVAEAGDTVTLSFTPDETIQTPTVAFTVGGASAAGSVTVTNTSGDNWTAAFTLTSGDTEGAVGFTIDFTGAAGNAAAQVTSTTDSSSVVVSYGVLAPGLGTMGAWALFVAFAALFVVMLRKRVAAGRARAKSEIEL